MEFISKTEDFFVIKGFTSPKLVADMYGVESAHKDIMEFIRSSATQMAQFLQSNVNDSRVLRTPSRRISKRKRSSIVTKSVPTIKKPISNSFKTKDVSMATPRRLSKRPKRSTIKLDTTVEQMDVSIIESKTVEVVEQKIQSFDDNYVESEAKTEINVDIALNEEIICENKVMTASNLMSELSISEENIQIKDKLNESENEWMTDDEESPKKKETEEFYDAIDSNKGVNKMNSSVTTTTSMSAAKDKHKKSLYFTPQTTTQRSTRAQTRMLSRIVDSSQKTPQIGSKISLSSKQKSKDTSLTTAGGSSARSVRSHSRIQRSNADNKTLTDSALKRRQEAEEQRRIRLLASQEKEKRAIEKRRILLEQTVNEKKLKSKEKANRAAEMRELQKQKESERMRKEIEKREEWERKHEEDRRELNRKRQEDVAQKTREIEKRKQLQELKETEAKQKKLEEITKKQELEKERLKEQERMAALIQQHNSSLQQKAVANSFIKKVDSSTQLVAKVMVSRLSPVEIAKHSPETRDESNDEPKASAKPISETKNQTFVVEDVSTYDMTPPPKEHNYDNYDISQIQSDDDTDDDQKPRKRIPNWARGSAFIEQVHRQYNRSTRQLNKEVKGVFGTGDELLDRFKLEFDLMFPKKPLHPKYAKRTSSAVWDIPPDNYRADESSVMESLKF